MPQEIKVDIGLSGGHQYTAYLRSDAPLLQSLFQAMMARSQPELKSELLQIPIHGDRAALCFCSADLISLTTEPAVFAEPTPAVQQTTVLASPYVQIDNFWTPEEHQRLLNYVLEQESAFVETTTSTAAANYRQSRALYTFPEFSELMTNRLKAVLPNVLQRLELPPFAISEIEAQLTAHNDNSFYKIHNDNGSPETATRELTYVYYFYREPKPFSGGELRVYDTKIENNYYLAADSFQTVEPRNNSVVFFFSRYMHEVLPIRCPSQAFADSRFTINGWVRR